MSRKLIIVLALAFVVGITCAAFAEVQNVKVSGDLTVVGATRSNLAFTKDSSADAWVSIARVKVDANLTDNVDVTIRLLNERVWGTADTATANYDTGVNLDLAYATLKDFMKDTINTPVTMVVGRQNIKIGSGLLVGKAGTNQGSALGNMP
jgi:hypothetical protein